MDIPQIWDEHGTTIVVAVVAVVMVAVAVKLLKPKKKIFVEDMTLNVRCKNCDWQGTVTKYNQTCRKCNSADLERFSG